MQISVGDSVIDIYIRANTLDSFTVKNEDRLIFRAAGPFGERGSYSEIDARVWILEQYINRKLLGFDLESDIKTESDVLNFRRLM